MLHHGTWNAYLLLVTHPTHSGLDWMFLHNKTSCHTYWSLVTRPICIKIVMVMSVTSLLSYSSMWPDTAVAWLEQLSQRQTGVLMLSLVRGGLIGWLKRCILLLLLLLRLRSAALLHCCTVYDWNESIHTHSNIFTAGKKKISHSSTLQAHWSESWQTESFYKLKLTPLTWTVILTRPHPLSSRSGKLSSCKSR